MRVSRAEIIAMTQRQQPHLSPTQQRLSRDFLNQLDLYAGDDLSQITDQVEQRGDHIEQRLGRARAKARVGLAVAIAGVLGSQVFGQALAPGLISLTLFVGGLGYAGLALQERGRWQPQAEQVETTLWNLRDCASAFGHD